MSLFVLWFFSSEGGESLKESSVVCTCFSGFWKRPQSAGRGFVLSQVTQAE